MSYRYHTQIHNMGNLASGFRFKTEFHTDPESDNSKGYIDNTYGGAAVVNANWLSGGKISRKDLGVISVLIIFSSSPVFNDLLASLDTSMSRMEKNVNGNWLGLILIAAFIGSLLVFATILVLKKLLEDRSKLRREVKSARQDRHLNIEMPALGQDNTNSPRRNAKFEFP